MGVTSSVDATAFGRPFQPTNCATLASGTDMLQVFPARVHPGRHPPSPVIDNGELFLPTASGVVSAFERHVLTGKNHFCQYFFKLILSSLRNGCGK